MLAFLAVKIAGHPGCRMISSFQKGWDDRWSAGAILGPQSTTGLDA